MIENIEYQIREESIQNRKRENELEDLYQNTKYKNKKVEGKSSNKLGFDNSTSLTSKRKSDKLK